MDSFWQFLGSYWWLAFPLAGIVGGWAKGAQKWDERRRRDKIELERIRYGGQIAATEAVNVVQSDIERVLKAHDDVNTRWLDYELDVAKMIDFPLMSDMREPLTVDFHRAKRAADGLRPDDHDELRNPQRLAEYRNAVQAFELAFDIAEREAKRRRTSGYSESERSALQRAKKLMAVADDSGATHAERQLAYRRAKTELEGLIVLPEAATDAMEKRIAGSLTSGPTNSATPPTPPAQPMPNTPHTP